MARKHLAFLQQIFPESLQFAVGYSIDYMYSQIASCNELSWNRKNHKIHALWTIIYSRILYLKVKAVDDDNRMQNGIYNKKHLFYFNTFLMNRLDSVRKLGEKNRK